VGALDGEAFLLELGQQAAQQGVVALAGGVDQGRDHGQAAQVGLDGREVGTIDDAREAHGLAALGPQRLEHLAELAQPDLDARIAGQDRFGRTSAGASRERPAGRLAVLGQFDRQGAAAGDQTKLAHSHVSRVPAGTAACWPRRG
jgi:hypothetical protein